MLTPFFIFVTIGALMNSGQYATKQFKHSEPFQTFEACEEFMKGPVFIEKLKITQKWVAEHELVDTMLNTTAKCREVK